MHLGIIFCRFTHVTIETQLLEEKQSHVTCWEIFGPERLLHRWAERLCHRKVNQILFAFHNLLVYMYKKWTNTIDSDHRHPISKTTTNDWSLSLSRSRHSAPCRTLRAKQLDLAQCKDTCSSFSVSDCHCVFILLYSSCCRKWPNAARQRRARTFTGWLQRTVLIERRHCDGRQKSINHY